MNFSFRPKDYLKLGLIMGLVDTIITFIIDGKVQLNLIWRFGLLWLVISAALLELLESKDKRSREKIESVRLSTFEQNIYVIATILLSCILLVPMLIISKFDLGTMVESVRTNGVRGLLEIISLYYIAKLYRKKSFRERNQILLVQHAYNGMKKRKTETEMD